MENRLGNAATPGRFSLHRKRHRVFPALSNRSGYRKRRNAGREPQLLTRFPGLRAVACDWLKSAAEDGGDGTSGTCSVNRNTGKRKTWSNVVPLLQRLHFLSVGTSHDERRRTCLHRRCYDNISVSVSFVLAANIRGV